MTIKSLFNIILKIIGVLFIKEILMLANQLLAIFYYVSADPEVLHLALVNAALTGIIFLFYLITARMLIFRSEMIINWMKLDKDFEEQNINVNIHRSVVLSIAIIVIGGLMVAEGIPDLIERWYTYNENEKQGLRPDIITVLMPAINIVIGVLLVNFHRQVVNLIEIRRKK